jgi:chromosome transmission fidelity protein 1
LQRYTTGRQAVRANATRSLHHIQQFILSLANADRDGRVLLSQTATPKDNDGKNSKNDVTLKYMLLAPSEAFRDVAEEARSVILAGGTMAPVRPLLFRRSPNHKLSSASSQMSDFREQLFPYLPAERFSTFSCGHVVPQEHVSTYAVSKGPTGVKFEFTFDKRKDEKLVRAPLLPSFHPTLTPSPF